MGDLAFLGPGCRSPARQAGRRTVAGDPITGPRETVGPDSSASCGKEVREMEAFRVSGSCRFLSPLCCPRNNFTMIMANRRTAMTASRTAKRASSLSPLRWEERGVDGAGSEARGSRTVALCRMETDSRSWAPVGKVLRRDVRKEADWTRFVRAKPASLPSGSWPSTSSRNPIPPEERMGLSGMRYKATMGDWRMPWSAPRTARISWSPLNG